MKRDFEVKGIAFSVRNYTPRKNEFEKGLKYELFVKRGWPGYPDGRFLGTGARFETIAAAKKYAVDNVSRWM